MPARKLAKHSRTPAEKSASRKARASKSPLKGMHPRHVKQGDLPPNQDHQKYPDEVYGDTEIPFRN